MKVGATIRPDMGENHVIKDCFSMIELLEEIKDRIDFIEIYCQYPFPVNLQKGLDELNQFLRENKIEVGLHFPAEYHDRWMKKKSFSRILKIMSDFSKKINAKFMMIHPGDLTYFLDATNREEILDGLTRINEKIPCKLVVENGITLLERADDLDFFAQGGIEISVNVCHTRQANYAFEMFAQNFKKWGSKLFMFHVSDYDETPHIELKKGKIKWGSILRKIRKTKAYGVCCETLYSKQDNIIYRAPKTSLINSLRFLQKVR